ncbi:hypothetical protein CAPTEDRAFT_195368 [Capitella teleta]|uniref:Uncharacterized protein n=1 Tax=Capitella teleta TaxID=283909 RepID=R7V3K6_CAPTE|nr:hypothetical protein CAPTEDRAFT_195368 [Capitella teleta]|eukprot:ELU10921.1 hypothetical protein CAPTEDRAFT_195368 [Capitella teleta]
MSDNFLQQIGYLVSSNRRNCKIKSDFHHDSQDQEVQERLTSKYKTQGRNSQEATVKRSSEIHQQPRKMRTVGQSPARVLILESDATPYSVTRSRRSRHPAHGQPHSPFPSGEKSRRQMPTNEVTAMRTSSKNVNGIRIERLTEKEIQDIRGIPSKEDKLAEPKINDSARDMEIGGDCSSPARKDNGS